jgi:hypothetical protein
MILITVSGGSKDSWPEARLAMGKTLPQEAHSQES